MSLQAIVFRQFLEEEEQIQTSFRQKFPGMKMIIFLLLTIGLAEGIRWMFFCSYDVDFCPNETMGVYAYGAIVILGIYQIFKTYFNWYANAVLMTSESLLFVEWKRFFSPKSRRLDYWDLDVVEVDRTGLKSYLGNFGTLVFHKISGGEPLFFEGIARPHKVETIIMKNREKMLDEKNFTEESALKDLISQLVQTHVRKNGQPERSFQKKSQEKKQEPDTHHFENEIEEVEKKLDDTGGIGIDL